MKKLLPMLFVIGLLSGCANFGLWLDKSIGNNDGKYDGPTVTVTKTLSNGMPVTVAVDESGALNVDMALVDEDGNLYEIVKDGSLSFEHDGVSYEVDLIREQSDEWS